MSSHRPSIRLAIHFDLEVPGKLEDVWLWYVLMAWTFANKKKSMLESREKCQQLWGSWGAPFNCRESGSIWTHFFVESFYLQVPINLRELIQLITYRRWWFQRFFSDVHLVFELDDSSTQFQGEVILTYSKLFHSQFLAIPFQATSRIPCQKRSKECCRRILQENTLIFGGIFDAQNASLNAFIKNK